MIFISHASVDADLGEHLIDIFKELGIPKDEIFFSSSYHTGVKVGDDFIETIKYELKRANIVIFILTEEFYRSVYCMNEMGAAWILEKKIFPILLPSIQIHEMEGVIDQRHIVCTAEYSKYGQFKDLLIALKKDSSFSDDAIKMHWSAFVSSASKRKIQKPNYRKKEISRIEEMILSGGLTDGELILLSYYIDNEIDHFDFLSFPDKDGKSFNSDEPIYRNFIEQYSNIDIKKVADLLEKSYIIKTAYDDFGKPYTWRISIDTFRNLKTLSDDAQLIIKNAKGKYRSTQSKPVASNKVSNFFKDRNASDVEKLLLCYTKEFSSFVLGARWKASAEIANIRQWEEINGLNHNLSNNYETILQRLVALGFFDVKSCTSYGNPREYELKNELKFQLLKLDEEILGSIEQLKKENHSEHSDDDVPF